MFFSYQQSYTQSSIFKISTLVSFHGINIPDEPTALLL